MIEKFFKSSCNPGSAIFPEQPFCRISVGILIILVLLIFPLKGKDAFKRNGFYWPFSRLGLSGGVKVPPEQKIMWYLQASRDFDRTLLWKNFIVKTLPKSCFRVSINDPFWKWLGIYRTDIDINTLLKAYPLATEVEWLGNFALLLMSLKIYFWSVK